MIQRKNGEVFLLSLRVLTAITQGVQPSRHELAILRKSAEPGEAGLPVDELCCALIRREIGTHDEVEDQVA